MAKERLRISGLENNLYRIFKFVLHIKYVINSTYIKELWTKTYKNSVIYKPQTRLNCKDGKRH